MYALVTGASSGIGREIARLLAARGYDLIVVARRGEELEKLREELTRSCGIAVVVRPLDLSRREECERLHAECRPFDPAVVVNCAGFGRVGAFTTRDLAGDLAMIDTNVVAVHILTKLFAGSMTEGRILNVASMAGFLPTPLFAAYSATKSYVVQLGIAVDYELRRAGRKVRISTLCPGPVETEFNVAAGSGKALRGMSAERCARIAVRGLFRGRRVIIPGMAMRIARFLVRFLPLGLILPAAYGLQKRK